MTHVDECRLAPVEGSVTAIQTRSYCRVVVIGPRTRVDVALPADVTIIDLLPMLLRYTGEAVDDTGRTGWRLTRVGHGDLPGGKTLRNLDILDGEVLQLVASSEHVAAPMYDDVVDVIASARRARIDMRSGNPGLGAAVIVAAALTAAATVFHRAETVVDAYLSGVVALVLLGVASAVARGAHDRIIAVATASGGIGFAFVCGLEIAASRDGAQSAWSALLGASLALAYSFAAIPATRSGTVVFSATATGSLFLALSALATGLADVDAIRIVGATAAVAFGALSLLPQLAMRLARLPLVSRPTAGRSGAGDDDAGVDDVADISRRARLAGDYLTGTQLGCAVTVAFSAVLLGCHAAAMSVALAAVVTVAMALRARSVPGLATRIAFVGSAGAAATAVAVFLLLTNHDAGGTGLLVAQAVVGVVAVVVSTSTARRVSSPQVLRLIDLVEATVILAVVPLAAGVLGLYSALRQH